MRSFIIITFLVLSACASKPASRDVASQDNVGDTERKFLNREEGRVSCEAQTLYSRDGRFAACVLIDINTKARSVMFSDSVTELGCTTMCRVE